MLFRSNDTATTEIYTTTDTLSLHDALPILPPCALLLAPQCAPFTGEREAEVREAAAELTTVCAAMKDGLDPLERQVREVFHRIVRSRMEGLDSLMLNAD